MRLSHFVNLRKNTTMPLSLAPRVTYTVYCSCGFSEATKGDTEEEVKAIILEHKIELLLEAANISFGEPDFDFHNIGGKHVKASKGKVRSVPADDNKSCAMPRDWMSE